MVSMNIREITSDMAQQQNVMRQWKPNRTGAEPQTGGCRIQTLKTSTLPLRTFDRSEEPVQQSKESFFRVS